MLAIAHEIEQAQPVRTRRPARDRSMGNVPAADMAAARYGADRRASWPAIALIIAVHAALIFAIVDGLIDERDIPHYASVVLGMPGSAEMNAPSTKRQVEIEQKQRDWMKTKGIE